MTYEIKEVKKIIKEIKSYENEELCLVVLTQQQNKALLDYITNLQEENKQLREHYLYIQEEMCLRWNELDNLQNEISDLKDTIQNKNNCIEAYDCIIKSRDERIDKAVEYIMTELITEWDIKNDGYVHGSDLPVDAITPLLDILRGDE